MFFDESGKFSSPAEYYYNDFIGMYCIVGTTNCNEDLDELKRYFVSDDLLTEITMPDYITADNCEDLTAW